MKKIILIIAITLWNAGVFTITSSDSDGTGALTLNNRILIFNDLKSTQQLIVTSTVGDGVEWSSTSGGNIAEVGSTGVVTPKSVGIDKILVKNNSSGYVDSCVVVIGLDSLVQVGKNYAKINENIGKIIVVSSVGKNGEIQIVDEKILFFVVCFLVVLGLCGWLFILLMRKRSSGNFQNQNEINSNSDKENLNKTIGNLSSEIDKLLNKTVNDLSSKIDRLINEKVNNLSFEFDKLRNEKPYNSNEKQKTQTEIFQHQQNQSQSLYADVIIDGKFNRVTEQPDSRSFFELTLVKAGDTQAEITIYPDAYGRVIANPAFLEGCDKQITGNTSVTVTKEGVATKDSDGKWRIIVPPEVRIS